MFLHENGWIKTQLLILNPKFGLRSISTFRHATFCKFTHARKLHKYRFRIFFFVCVPRRKQLMRIHPCRSAASLYTKIITVELEIAQSKTGSSKQNFKREKGIVIFVGTVALFKAM